jgi:hypothetical protein
VQRFEPGRVIGVPTHQDQILRILSESGDPLFLSEITERLNVELVSGPAVDTAEVFNHLQSLYEQVTRLRDGRWMLKGWCPNVERVSGSSFPLSMSAFHYAVAH